MKHKVHYHPHIKHHHDRHLDLVLLWAGAILLLILLACSASGQTPPMPDTTEPATNSVVAPAAIGPVDSGILQEAYDKFIASTNYAVASGYLRGMTGNKNVWFITYLYNLGDHAALVLGYDYVWANMEPKTSFANILRGGLNLHADVYPLKRWNQKSTFYVTPFAYDLLATPTSGTDNNGGLGNIAGAGVEWKAKLWKDLDFHLGVLYENRTGQGDVVDGNYAGGFAALSWRF